MPLPAQHQRSLPNFLIHGIDDIDAMMDLFQPEGTFSTPVFAMPLSGDSMRAYIASLLSSMPDMKATVVSAGAFDANLHASRYVVTGTWTKPATVGPLAGMTPTGKPIRLDAGRHSTEVSFSS